MGCSGKMRECWYCGHETNACFCSRHCSTCSRPRVPTEQDRCELKNQKAQEKKRIEHISEESRRRVNELKARYPDWENQLRNKRSQ